MKKILLLAAAAVIGLTASAQFSNSGGSADAADNSGWNTVYFQYNPMTLHYKGNNSSDDQSFNGLALGYSHAFALTKSVPIYLKTGRAMQYSFWSESDSDGGEKATSKIQLASLKVPINFMYKWRIPNSRVDIIPFFGLSLRGNLWGQAKDEVSYRGEKESNSVNLFSSSDDEMGDYAWKRFQIGWQLGVKARFIDKILVGVSYGTDFNKISGGKDYPGKLRGAEISLGYCF